MMVTRIVGSHPALRERRYIPIMETRRGVRRGIRRGMYLAMTGDTSSLPRMRRELESKDVVTGSWIATGQALRLPEPRELQGYEDVVPGSAERIVRMAERSAEERNAALRRLTMAEAWSVAITAISFALAPLVLTAATVVAVLQGSDVAAVVTGVAAALSAAPKVIAAIRGDRNDESPLDE